MLLPSPYSRWLPSPRWLRLGRERDTIYNNYDRKFAAWSTHIQGLSFVNTRGDQGSLEHVSHTGANFTTEGTTTTESLDGQIRPEHNNNNTECSLQMLEIRTGKSY